MRAAEQEEEIAANYIIARVILHEYDHLIGKMIPDRVTEKQRKKMQDFLMKIKNREIFCEYPITDKIDSLA